MITTEVVLKTQKSLTRGKKRKEKKREKEESPESGKFVSPCRREDAQVQSRESRVPEKTTTTTKNSSE